MRPSLLSSPRRPLLLALLALLLSLAFVCAALRLLAPPATETDSRTQADHRRLLDLSQRAVEGELRLPALLALAPGPGLGQGADPLSQVEVLFASGNGISGIARERATGLLILSRLPRLRVLSLKDNALQRLALATADAPQLEQLILTGNAITQLSVAHARLRKLMLAYNRLRALPAAMVEGLPQLELARFANNAIAHVDSAWWFEMGRLAWVALAGNPWLKVSPAEVAAAAVEAVDVGQLQLHEKVGREQREAESADGSVCAGVHVCVCVHVCVLVCGAQRARCGPRVKGSALKHVNLNPVCLLLLGPQLGEGTSGVAFRGTYKQTPVAVKISKGSSSDGVLEVRELGTLVSPAPFRCNKTQLPAPACLLAWAAPPLMPEMPPFLTPRMSCLPLPSPAARKCRSCRGCWPRWPGLTEVGAARLRQNRSDRCYLSLLNSAAWFFSSRRRL